MAAGASPMWHPDECALYWCDSVGRALHRLDPASGARACWPFPGEVGCCAPAVEGGLMLTLGGGVWRFDPASGERKLLARPRRGSARLRCSDGRADALGRYWYGTAVGPQPPADAGRTDPRKGDADGDDDAVLFCLSRGRLLRMAEGGVRRSAGIAFSPDSRTLYWADADSCTVFAFDFDLGRNLLSRRRVFARFGPAPSSQPAADESGVGRPGGAAVDVQGRYWLALPGSGRLQCLAPDGSLLHELVLPVSCPTMPCFGGADLRTLYVTSARAGRPAAELAREPLAGCVLAIRVDVPGLPAHYARWR